MAQQWLDMIPKAGPHASEQLDAADHTGQTEIEK
jgi:hypothetical protein